MAPGNINENIQWHVLFPLCTILVVGSAALKLPYEVQQSILAESELDDLKDLKGVNVSDGRGPTRPIYRLDLDPEYVTYTADHFYELAALAHQLVEDPGHALPF